MRISHCVSVSGECTKLLNVGGIIRKEGDQVRCLSLVSINLRMRNGRNNRYGAGVGMTLCRCCGDDCGALVNAANNAVCINGSNVCIGACKCHGLIESIVGSDSPAEAER